MSGGKDTIVIADVGQDDMRSKMLEWAQKNGISNGQLNKTQFAQYWQAQRPGGFNRGGGRQGGFNRGGMPGGGQGNGRQRRNRGGPGGPGGTGG